MNKIDIPSTTGARGNFIDRWGTEWKLNSHGFRTVEFDEIDFTQPRALAMGCSHTMGDGNKFEYSWPEVLKEKINFSQIINLGQFGASSDYVVRILPNCLQYFKPTNIFIFWPDYARFEINENGRYRQIVPTSEDRIKFMSTHPEEYLRDHYSKNLDLAQKLCLENNVKLIGISWNDLISTMDHADRWDKGVDNAHYGKLWHEGVAEVFKDIFYEK